MSLKFLYGKLERKYHNSLFFKSNEDYFKNWQVHICVRKLIRKNPEIFDIKFDFKNCRVHDKKRLKLFIRRVGKIIIQFVHFEINYWFQKWEVHIFVKKEILNEKKIIHRVGKIIKKWCLRSHKFCIWLSKGPFLTITFCNFFLWIFLIYLISNP